jgi:hypothetical protein
MGEKRLELPTKFELVANLKNCESPRPDDSAVLLVTRGPGDRVEVVECPLAIKLNGSNGSIPAVRTFPIAAVQFLKNCRSLRLSFC